MPSGLEILDIILDTIDNIFPGLIGLLSGTIITSKKKIKNYAKHYEIISSRLKLFYFVFVLFYLLFNYFGLKKRVIEVNIYIKIFTTIFNLLLLYSATIKIFK